MSGLSALEFSDVEFTLNDDRTISVSTAPRDGTGIWEYSELDSSDVEELMWWLEKVRVIWDTRGS